MIKSKLPNVIYMFYSNSKFLNASGWKKTFHNLPVTGVEGNFITSYRKSSQT